MIIKNCKIGMTNNFKNPKNSIFDYIVRDCNSKDVKLDIYKNYKNILIVNVASYWGLTNKNYEELEYLYKKYDNLMILGFPCNQFGNQEPKTNKEIQEFVKNKNVTFPVFSKIDVNGNNEDPLYTYLKKNKSSFFGRDIKWNFTKFLCVDGIPVERFGPQRNPLSFEDKIN